MPGGSINGRPFKESRDSYSKTGIPCGNPRRFHSQDVVRMGLDKSVRSRDLSGPVEDIETEGQRQLKTLLEKQLDPSATVKQQLAQSRKFTHGTLFKPSSDNIEGIIDLSDYRALEEADDRVTELRLCGLTDEEIKLKLENLGFPETQGTTTKKARLGHEPSYIQDKLKEIDRKIEQHKLSLEKPDTFAGQKSLGRHAMDLERSLTRDRGENKQISTMLLTNQPKSTSDAYPHPNDPMNHIPDILKELNTKTFTSRRKKGRSVVEPAEYSTVKDTDQGQEETDTSSVIGCKTKEEFLSDTPSLSVTTEGEIANSKGEQCPNTSSDNNKHDKESSDVKIIQHLVSQVPESDILSNKLSVEELRKLQKFSNYQTGNPSNVLYIKNLPNKVTENELGSLFLRFQKNNEQPLLFRIMTGKMKGQAFVTFSDIETASRAIQLLNGYKLHDKPMVIQYGRNKQ